MSAALTRRPARIRAIGRAIQLSELVSAGDK
jgi:hypothetical protein